MSSLLYLWHLGTGHIGIDALRNLHLAVFDLQPLQGQFEFPCYDCMQSEMPQRNKPPSSESWSDRPFEIVQFFVDKPTISGFKIDSHFVDGYSRCKILLFIILKARCQQYLINIKQLSIHIAGKVQAIISKLKEFVPMMLANLQEVKCNNGFT